MRQANDPPHLARVKAALQEHGSEFRTTSGTSEMWQCPVHDDGNASLAVGMGESDVVTLYCFVCSENGDSRSYVQRLVDKLGLRLADLRPGIDWQRGPDEIYDYFDERGRYVFSVFRFPGKQFRQGRKVAQNGKHQKDWRWVGRDGVLWGVDGVRLVPYGLKKLVTALAAGEDIHVCEGEADVHALRRAGAVATTNPGGAGKWREEFSTFFEGTSSRVFVHVDQDGPQSGFKGQSHALEVLDSLRSIEVAANLLAPAEGKDPRDHLTAGHAVDAFVPVDESALRSLLAGVEDDAFERDVANRVRSDRVRQEALRRAAALGWEAPPPGSSLAEALAQPPSPPVFVVDELIPEGANVLIAAKYKSGKSTLVLNLARALVDGEKFLDEFCVHLPEGNVAWWNAEIGEAMAVGWLRDMDVVRGERMFMQHLRGHSVPLRSEPVRDWAVKWLRDNDVKVWIVDPFGALYDGDENDNAQVRGWLQALDEIKRLAGVDVLVVVTHTGHSNGEDEKARARGAARLMDWGDVNISYTGEGDGPRYLEAMGRDVAVPSRVLTFDAETRRLTLLGAGSVTGGRIDRLVQEVVRAVEASYVQTGRPISKTSLEASFSGKSDHKRRAIETAVQTGQVRVEAGPNNTQFHYPAEARQQAESTSPPQSAPARPAKKGGPARESAPPFRGRTTGRTPQRVKQSTSRKGRAGGEA